MPSGSQLQRPRFAQLQRGISERRNRSSSCARPVIATNVGGIPELVNEKSGILAAPRDSRALAGAIETAMERNWDEHSISEQFRRSWDEAADELLRVCELAIQQRSHKLQLAANVTTALSR